MTNGEKFKDVFGFGADGSRVIAVNSTWWDCEFQSRKPKTNADRIRAMSNEELAEFMCHNVSNGTVNCAFCAAAEFCRMGHNGWIDWLKQEAE
jgi:hypothetical protein